MFFFAQRFLRSWGSVDLDLTKNVSFLRHLRVVLMLTLLHLPPVCCFFSDARPTGRGKVASRPFFLLRRFFCRSFPRLMPALSRITTGKVTKYFPLPAPLFSFDLSFYFPSPPSICTRWLVFIALASSRYVLSLVFPVAFRYLSAFFQRTLPA